MKKLLVPTALVSIGLLITIAMKLGPSRKPVVRSQALNIYVPFLFSDSIDPLNISTVGDQMLAEHVFAFHAKSTLSGGFDGVVSTLDFSKPQMVVLKPRLDLATADGTRLSIKEICNSVSESVSGSRHASYASLLKRVSCQEEIGEIRIEYSKIPVNLRMLFTLPDYAVFDRKSLPVRPGNLKTTGPYSLSFLSSDKASLSPNAYFPADLVSNRLPVELTRYSAGQSSKFVSEMSDLRVDAAYLYGQAIQKADVEVATNNGYVAEIYPAEWLVYLNVSPNVSTEIRTKLRRLVSAFQDTEDFRNTLGAAAYSVSPSNQPFGLKKNDVSLSGEDDLPKVDLSGVRFGTLENWANQPVFRSFVEFLKQKASGLNFETLSPSDMGKLFGGDFDIVLRPLGMSPSDPLTHLHFLADTDPNLAKSFDTNAMLSAATLTDESQFALAIREIEMRPVVSGLLIPIGHFPGVVLRKASIRVNEKQVFGWGIQAWSFQVD